MMRATLLILSALLLASQAQAADLSGTYTGSGGTVILKRARDIPALKPKPKFRKEFGGDGMLGTTPKKFEKAKDKLAKTTRMLPDAYLVTFDMGSNPKCPLKWKGIVARKDGKALVHADISPERFSFEIEESPEWTGLYLDIPAEQVREMGGKCAAGEAFFRKKKNRK